jgi:hypothetical protein
VRNLKQIEFDNNQTKIRVQNEAKITIISILAISNFNLIIFNKTKQKKVLYVLGQEQNNQICFYFIQITSPHF